MASPRNNRLKERIYPIVSCVKVVANMMRITVRLNRMVSANQPRVDNFTLYLCDAGIRIV
jgi:hypothetical protein